MKRIACLVLAVVLLMSLVACGHTHAFGQWSTVSDATCTKEGAKERVCECGEKETETIAATGHTFGEVKELVPVSCTEDGQTEQSCTVCGEVVTETVAATGHSFTAATAFAPKTCTACGETEGEALATLITMGGEVEAEDHSFTVESATFTGKLKEKRGNVTYTYGGGDYVYAIKLKFTNLATEAFERWNSDRVSEVAMEYKGKYQYEGDYWCPDDDIVPLASDSMYIVFSVPESMSADATSSIVVSFTIDGTTYAMVVQEGDGAVEEEAVSAEANTSAALNKGDERSDGENFSFVVKDVYYTSKPSEKNGNVTHSFGNGGYYLAIKLEFTNLGTEAMDGWNSDRLVDMQATYDDKYTYDGTAWIPGNDIVPLSTGNVYVLFEIPESVETGSEPLTAKFVVDGNEFNIDCRANG